MNKFPKCSKLVNLQRFKDKTEMEQELNKCLDVEAVRDKLQFRDVESC